VDRRRSGTVVDRGGQIIVRLFHTESDKPIEIYLWEDEAEVRHGNVHERFKLARVPTPYGWIPDALNLVERLLMGPG
jgi:hypothetical protein